MSTPIALVTGTRTARRVLMDGGRLSAGWEIAGTIKSANVDAGNSAMRTTILRPGNILLKGADGLWYDDVTTGVPSAGAIVRSAEAPDADWQSATITLTVNGIAVVTVSLGAGDDTIAEVVTALNADSAFRAWAIASDNGADDLVKITLIEPGAERQVKVTSSLSSAFGADGTEAHGTDGDWAVLPNYLDMFDGNGVVANQQGIQLLRRGHFDESNLIWTGAATLPADFKRIMLARGSFFES